jgi:peptide/nickel transport system substrate-binding protein
MQFRHFGIHSVDLLRAFAKKRKYRILRYESTGRSTLMLNLQYPGDEVLRKIFQDKRFRQALSMAIDRKTICSLCHRGYASPAGFNLLPSSPDYVEVEGLPDYARYAPKEANRLLDAMGLDKRDGEGYRLRPDGERLSLIIEAAMSAKGSDVYELVRSNWEAVGAQTTLKPESRTLYFQRVTKTGEHMIGCWGVEAVLPLVVPHRWFGTNLWDEWGHHWARWYLTKGRRGVEPPPEVKRLQQIHELLEVTTDAGKRKALWREVVRSHAENVWVIPITERSTAIGVLAERFRNVPLRTTASWILMSPGNLNPETFFIKP